MRNPKSDKTISAESQVRDDRARRGLSRRGVTQGLAVGGLVLLAGGTAWLGGGGAPKLRTATRRMMGTEATIIIGHEPSAEAEDAVRDAFAAMEQVAADMTRFEAHSDIGRANGTPNQWVAVTPATAHVVRSALALSRASDGAFDPTLDRLSVLWGFHNGEQQAGLPEMAAIAPWRNVQGYRQVELRREAGRDSLRLAPPPEGSAVGVGAGVGVALDLGGIAKGYAVDQAVARLRAHGVRHALIEAGGDIYALGAKPDGDPWTLGVRNPKRPSSIYTTIAIADAAVATSGDYINYRDVNGRRYGHILDPRTAMPTANLSSLTVLADTAMNADGLATAAFNAAGDALQGQLKRLGARRWLAMDTHGQEQAG